ncbi:MAG: zinc dependent phospholipase C family protein [Bacteroidota bacterium]|nr:zinc dependent phospholipase C family protein [Candidatus Kapabacteria bacterium]MDW8221012.1 zinc dependent phospholipase C family protein [Bacteroidota bacterium]
MPKEITHWLIAEETARQVLPYHLTTEEQALLRLGAILHDVLYYVVCSTASRRRCTALANTLHGASGEDTFTVFRLLRKHVLLAENSQIQHSVSQRQYNAFTLGALTHYVTDVVFHPCIYYMSGNCFDSASRWQSWRNHRTIESTYDVLFCNAFQANIHAYSLWHDLQHAQSVLHHIFYALASAQRRIGWEVTAQDYQQGYQNLAWLRAVYSQKLLNALLDYAERAILHLYPSYERTQVASYLALRYSVSSPWNASHIDAPLYYQHPVSGDAYTTCLRELFNQAVQHSIQLWLQMEQELCSATSHLGMLQHHGLSLEVGLHAVPMRSMQYFAS